MKIGIVVVTHSYDMAPLHASVQGTAHDIRWYVHHHGGRNEVAAFLRSLGGDPKLKIAWHFYNRGLARSWNDGLHASRRDGNDITLLINDDVHFEPSAFDQFMIFIQDHDRADLCFVFGQEPSGIVRQQGFACCSIGHNVIDRIGFFDENYFPAYYEDIDYSYRALFSSIPIHIDERVLVFHQRNATTRNRRLLQFFLKWNGRRLRRYHVSKWGIVDGAPTTAVPFAEGDATLKIAWDERADPYRSLGRRPLLAAALRRWADAWRRLPVRTTMRPEGWGGRSPVALAPPDQADP